jgi:glycosyltransferase involved in cell wall biosynthesis
MKICYLSLLPKFGSPAGSGVLKVSETLLKEYETIPGIEIHAISLQDGLPHEFSRVSGSVTYHYIPCKSHFKTLTGYFLEKIALRKKILQISPQLCHAQPSSEYLMTATEWNGPHVITIHGLVLRETKGARFWSRGVLENFIREIFQRRAVSRAKNIISISPYVDEYIQGLASPKIWHIPNPIDHEFFELKPSDSELLKIICVGILSARKNQKVLIQACAILKQRNIPFECHIVGRSSSGASKELESEIQVNNLQENVKLRGLLPDKDLIAEYAWANTVVLPSLEETAPLSLIQSLCSGRITIGANAAGIPALLDGGRRGHLFEPTQPISLANTLENIARNIKNFLHAAEQQKIDIEKLYHPRQVALKTLSTYQKILKQQTSQHVNLQ